MVRLESITRDLPDSGLMRESPTLKQVEQIGSQRESTMEIPSVRIISHCLITALTLKVFYGRWIRVDAADARDLSLLVTQIRSLFSYGGRFKMNKRVLIWNGIHLTNLEC